MNKEPENPQSQLNAPLIQSQGDHQLKELDSFQYCIKDLNLDIDKGLKCSIYGKVGSGKTTLLLSLVGEQPLAHGSLKVSGTVAYCPQEAFLCDGTVKDNILFGNEFIQNRFDKCIRVCQFEEDLLALPQAEMTMVGESGLKLSGGQRQRIALARALYSDSDILALDDCLSALDHKVAVQVYKDAIHGYLWNKTVLFVTNDLTLKEDFGIVITVEDMRISDIKRNQIISPQQSPSKNHHKINISSSSQANKISLIFKPPKKSAQAPTENPNSTKISEFSDTSNLGLFNFTRYSGSPLFFGVIILWSLFTFFKIFFDYWFGLWTNDPDRLGDPFRVYLTVTCYLIIAILIVLVARSLVYGQLVEKGGYQIHSSLIENIKKRSFTFFDLTPSSQLLSKSTKEVGILDNQLALFYLFFLTNIMTFIGFFVTVAISVPYMVIIFVANFLVAAYLIKKYNAVAVKLRDISQKTTGPFLNCFYELFSGLPVIRCAQKEDFFRNKMFAKLDDKCNSQQHELFSRQWINIWLEFIVALIVGLVGLGVTAANTYG